MNTFTEPCQHIQWTLIQKHIQYIQTDTLYTQTHGDTHHHHQHQQVAASGRDPVYCTLWTLISLWTSCQWGLTVAEGLCVRVVLLWCQRMCAVTEDVIKGLRTLLWSLEPNGWTFLFSSDRSVKWLYISQLVCSYAECRHKNKSLSKFPLQCTYWYVSVALR